MRWQTISYRHMFIITYQAKLVGLCESVHMRVDFPARTATLVCHHKEIHSTTGGDVGESTDIVCCKCLNGHIDSPPVVENGPRAGAQDEEETAKGGGEGVPEVG